MCARVLFGLVGALIVALALGSSSGAATAKAQKVTRIDVSTRAAVIHYLRSIHVNPKGAVIQRGGLNYAGAHCPGVRWTCAGTRHTVVQIAKRGGTNRYVCKSSKCVVVQLSGVSRGVYITRRTLAATSTAATGTQTATCIRTSGLGQSCSITQSSSTKNNKAVVYESAAKSSGLTQSATSTASITQQATGSASSPNSNEACVYQAISIDGSTVAKKGTPVTVNLQAHQSITIKQDSTNGTNTASEKASQAGGCLSGGIVQDQTLTSTANGSGPITQNEDNVYSPCGDGRAGEYANLCLDIEQNQGIAHGSAHSGANDANFTQTSSQTAIANTPQGPVSQTQSTPLCSDPSAPAGCVFPGGLVGTINQDSSVSSSGTATQVEKQCEDAALSGLATCHTGSGDDDFNPPYQLTQKQYGPIGVGKIRNNHAGRRRVGFSHGKGLGQSIQTGGSGNQFQINQTSTQDADQQSGQQNFGQADCRTSGTCTVTQITSVDGQTTTNTQSGQDINTSTNCTGSDCQTSGPPPPSPTFTWNGSQLTAQNVSMSEFGFGGMRGGDGTGSITVSGINGPVARAYLYWHGDTNSTDPTANANVTFAGTGIAGTNIGIDSDNNWGFTNSQAYRADVTNLVTGNNTYSLSGFDAGTNGVALIVFTAGNRNVGLWNGNDSNCAFGPNGAATTWDETITGVPYAGGTASLDFVVGDGQTFDDGTLAVNGTTMASGDIFHGGTTPGVTSPAVGSLWDIRSFDLTNFLNPGSNDLHITNSGTADCLSLVVAAANVPVSAPIG